MVILQSQACFSKRWAAVGLVSGQRPTEQLLEAEEQKPERLQHPQAFQLIYIHNALFLPKAVFTAREIHKSVEELSFPAELIQLRSLASVWTIGKSDGQQKSALALHKHLPPAADSFHLLFVLSRVTLFEDKKAPDAFIPEVNGDI